MRYVVTSTLLYSRLQNIERVILPKNNIQILSCFLFDIKGNTMEITASDQDTTLKTSVELLEANGDFKFALESKQIMNILKEIPEQPLTFEINPMNLQIELSYLNGCFEFQGEAGEEYPQAQNAMGEDRSIVLNSAQLAKGIATTIVATANDESRKVMNGIYMDITPEDLSIVASDGRKLIRYLIQCETNGTTANFTIPQKPATLLRNILEKENGDVTIHTYDGRNAMVEMQNYVMSCRLIEERYPNYKSVIPTMNENIAVIDRVSLISALKRILVVADKTTILIKLQFENNTLTLTSENINYSLSAEEQLVCQYEGMPIKIGFKGSNLLELLNNLQGNDVVMKLSDNTRACLILPAEQEENVDLLMLLMPLLINN